MCFTLYMNSLACLSLLTTFYHLHFFHCFLNFFFLIIVSSVFQIFFFSFRYNIHCLFLFWNLFPDLCFIFLQVHDKLHSFDEISFQHFPQMVHTTTQSKPKKHSRHNKIGYWTKCRKCTSEQMGSSPLIQNLVTPHLSVAISSHTQCSKLEEIFGKNKHS